MTSTFVRKRLSGAAPEKAPKRSPHRKIVLKIEEGMDRADVHCTTYQMRDVFQQIATAWVTSQEVMSLSMHQAAAFMARKGDRVLDVCCGRAMMLPLLRRHRPNIHSYVGVDIEPKNWAPAYRWSARTPIEGVWFAPNHERMSADDEPWYPFPVTFAEEDVSAMYKGLEPLGPFDYVVYMAAIEHMQRDAGAQSLRECYDLMKPGGRLFLTSPNTADPNDPQYAAHLYEWGQAELLAECEEIGFELETCVGLLAKATGFRDKVVRYYPALVPVFDRLAAYLPSAWLYAMFPILTPDIADEVGFIFTKGRWRK